MTALLFEPEADAACVDSATLLETFGVLETLTTQASSGSDATTTPDTQGQTATYLLIALFVLLCAIVLKLLA